MLAVSGKGLASVLSLCHVSDALRDEREKVWKRLVVKHAVFLALQISDAVLSVHARVYSVVSVSVLPPPPQAEEESRALLKLRGSLLPCKRGSSARGAIVHTSQLVQSLVAILNRVVAHADVIGLLVGSWFPLTLHYHVLSLIKYGSFNQI